jgi:hypothetical protein
MDDMLVWNGRVADPAPSRRGVLSTRRPWFSIHELGVADDPAGRSEEKCDVREQIQGGATAERRRRNRLERITGVVERRQ